MNKIDIYISGTCEDMCPIREVNQRTRERLVHYYEKNRCFVKEFNRSAAGRVQPKPEELRTKRALVKTVQYLLTDIFEDDQQPFHIRYGFIFDRFWSVRQEMVIQNFAPKAVVEILEPIIIFLAYSRYFMIGESINNFDPKINDQHLQECLTKLLVYYDILEDETDAVEIVSNRSQFEALYVLFNLESTEALLRCLKLPDRVKKDEYVQLALKIAIYYLSGNYYRVLQQIKLLPAILQATAALHTPILRGKLLKIFATGFHSKTLNVSLEWLKEVLFYETKNQLIDDLKYFNLEVVDDKHVKMDKTKFDISKRNLLCIKFTFIDNKLKDCVRNNLFSIKKS